MNVLKIISSFHKSLGLNLVVGICQPYFGTSQLNQMDFFFLPSLKLSIIYKAWLPVKAEILRHVL